MNYNLIADTTAIVHITIIIAVLIGLLISFRYKRFRPFEAGILIVIVVLWSHYGNCPLTIVEEYFRVLAGNPTGITNVGFLPYYANKLMGLELSSRLVQKTTFFTGGMFFAASISWFEPFFHMEVFKIRKILHRKRRYSRA